jgi:hypothetical protein
MYGISGLRLVIPPFNWRAGFLETIEVSPSELNSLDHRTIRLQNSNISLYNAYFPRIISWRIFSR